MDANVVPPPRADRARPSAMTNQAYTRLRDAIGNLVLQPGQPLTEASLSEWLGIGRTPVREALMRLRDEDLIDAIPRKGYYVTRISADQANEIYEMLEGLEGIAIKLATERASDDDFVRLDQAVKAQQAALDSDDLDAWVIADEQFHEAIIEIAGNQRIHRTIEPLNTQLHRLRSYTIRARPKPTSSTEAHRDQLKAMKNRDGELARRLIQDHRSQYRKVMVQIIRQLTGPYGGL